MNENIHTSVSFLSLEETNLTYIQTNKRTYLKLHTHSYLQIHHYIYIYSAYVHTYIFTYILDICIQTLHVCSKTSHFSIFFFLLENKNRLQVVPFFISDSY